MLPTDPAPGFGGLLLGAVIATHLPDIDPDLVADVHRLVRQVEHGQRIPQPRLRHRYQVDRHGLAVSVHRMIGDGDNIRFDLHAQGSALAQVLGAVYAIERLDHEARRLLAPVLQRDAVARPDRTVVHRRSRRHLVDVVVGDGRSAGLGARAARFPTGHRKGLPT